MKILLVNKFLYPNGGSETYLFSVGQELQALGHEVQYFGMEHEGRIVGNHAESYTEAMSFRSDDPDKNMATGRIRKKLSKLTYPFKIIYSLDAKKKIRKVLEDFHPDVVHLNNINFQITPSVIDEIKAFDSNIRVVYTAHDPQWVCPNHMMRIPSTGELCSRCIDGDVRWCAKNRCIHNSRMQSLLGTVEAKFYQHRKTYEKVDAIIAPSKFIGDTLAHNPQLRGRIVVLRNPLNAQVPNVDQNGPSLESKFESPADAGLSNRSIGAGAFGKTAFVDFASARYKDETPGSMTRECLDFGKKSDKGGLEWLQEQAEAYVLYFGRFSEEKGIRTAIQAAQNLPEIPFVFAGKGELEQEVSCVPNIQNVGFLSGEQMQQAIRGAKFTIFPSEWYENCPYSVVESELAGTPVLGSRLGGTPELVVDGVTGELFEAGNVQELTDKIRNLWNDETKLRQYRDGCQKLAEGKLELAFDTLEDYCRKLIRIYQGETF